MELCQIGANQGLTAEIGWNYTPQDRRCRKILIGLVVRGAKTVVVRGKNRILTQNRKNPEMTVPISQNRKNPEMTVPISWISCSGCENSCSSGKKPNFDPKPQKPRNDSSYQLTVSW